MDFPFIRLLAAALIALVPAAVAWSTGRRLIRLVDDPALPERLNASAQRRGVVTGAALAAILVLAGRYSVWLLILMFISLLADGLIGALSYETGRQVVRIYPLP